LLISELLKEISAPGVSAEAAFSRARIGVSRASNGDQVPLVSSSLIENFAFVPAAPRQADVAVGGIADKATSRTQTFEATASSSADAGEAANRATPDQRSAEAPARKTTSTGSASQYELASRPAPVVKDTVKPVEEAKRP